MTVSLAIIITTKKEYIPENKPSLSKISYVFETEQNKNKQGNSRFYDAFEHGPTSGIKEKNQSSHSLKAPVKGCHRSQVKTKNSRTVNQSATYGELSSNTSFVVQRLFFLNAQVFDT